jgi:hypothetical protein
MIAHVDVDDSPLVARIEALESKVADLEGLVGALRANPAVARGAEEAEATERRRHLAERQREEERVAREARRAAWRASLTRDPILRIEPSAGAVAVQTKTVELARRDTGRNERWIAKDGTQMRDHLLVRSTVWRDQLEGDRDLAEAVAAGDLVVQSIDAAEVAASIDNLGARSPYRAAGDYTVTP